jgi:AraC-like DNA-binding protein
MRALVRAPKLGFAERPCDEAVHLEAQLAHENEIAEARDWVPFVFVNDALAAIREDTSCMERILNRAQLNLRDAAPDLRISTRQFAVFWEIFAEETGDEFFLLDRRGLPSGSFTLMCHAILRSPTLEAAMRRLLRFFSVLLHDFEASLTVVDGIATIRLNEMEEKRSSFAYATWIVMLLGIASWLIDRRVALTRVEFRSPANGTDAYYRRLFCMNTRFNRPQTSLSFDASLLWFEPMRTEEQLKRFLHSCPEALMTQYRSRDTLGAQIRDELRHFPPDAWPSFEGLAAILLTTPSTLRRRLAAEGSSYQKIKDAIRRERAIAQLTDSHKPIVEIAEELGFSDPSTFYRAFKKWTGATPNHYRMPAMA